MTEETTESQEEAPRDLPKTDRHQEAEMGLQDREVHQEMAHPEMEHQEEKALPEMAVQLETVREVHLQETPAMAVQEMVETADRETAVQRKRRAAQRQ